MSWGSAVNGGIKITTSESSSSSYLLLYVAVVVCSEITSSRGINNRNGETHTTPHLLPYSYGYIT